MWSFLVPVALTSIFLDSLLQVSILLFIQTFICGALGSLMGAWVDKSGRLRVVFISLLIQNISVIISAILVLFLMEFGEDNITTNGEEETMSTVWTNWKFLLFYLSLCIFNAISSLFSIASSLSVERDWVVELCRGDELLLTQTNSVMQRIDLLCKIGGPAFLGFVLQLLNVYISLIIIALWNLFSFFFEYFLLYSIYSRNLSLLDKNFNINNNNNNNINNNLNENDIKNDIENESEINDNDGELNDHLIDDDKVHIVIDTFVNYINNNNNNNNLNNNNNNINNENNDNNENNNNNNNNDNKDENKEIKERLINEEENNKKTEINLKMKIENEENNNEKIIYKLEEENNNKNNKNNNNNNIKKIKKITQMKKTILEYIKGMFLAWKLYFNHEILLASLSFVSLFMTVLSPGGIMSSFLTSQKIQYWILGTYLGLSAIIGLLATYTTSFVVKYFGLKKGGVEMIFLQWFLLIGSPFLLYFQPPFYLYFFMALVAVSRFPLWSFDLIERQIMQQSIEKKDRGSINSVESSLCSIFYFFSACFTIIWSHPDQFIYLTIMSVIAVFSSFVFFTLWSIFITIKYRNSPQNQFRNFTSQNSETNLVDDSSVELDILVSDLKDNNNNNIDNNDNNNNNIDNINNGLEIDQPKSINNNNDPVDFI